MYNDGVKETDEGFVMLLGVFEEELDDEDVGFVDILTPAILVRLEEGGIYHTHACHTSHHFWHSTLLQTPGSRFTPRR